MHGWGLPCHCLQFSVSHYNIAFVNPERCLVKSRVYITQCRHGKFPATCKHGNFLYPSGF